MRIKGTAPRKSEAGHSKSLAASILCVLLIVGAYVAFNPACFARQEQRVEELQAQPVSQTETDSPKASGPNKQSPPPAAADSKSAEKKKRVARGAFMVAPLPISSPALGAGIAPVLAYIFPVSTKHQVSPSSVIGAAGLGTNNGSRGFAVGGQLDLKGNRDRITAGFARGNVNNDIYSRGSANSKLPLNQTGQAFFAERLRRVGWRSFLGPRFITGRSFLSIRPNSDSNFPIPPDTGLHTTLTALGARLTRDTSLNRFYPIGGTDVAFTSDLLFQSIRQQVGAHPAAETASMETAINCEDT